MNMAELIEDPSDTPIPNPDEYNQGESSENKENTESPSDEENNENARN